MEHISYDDQFPGPACPGFHRRCNSARRFFVGLRRRAATITGDAKLAAMRYNQPTVYYNNCMREALLPLVARAGRSQLSPDIADITNNVRAVRD